MEGKVFYSLVKGSNTAETYSIYLTELADKLDEELPGWRKTHIIIQDNATIHKGPAVIKTIREN